MINKICHRKNKSITDTAKRSFSIPFNRFAQTDTQFTPDCNPLDDKSMDNLLSDVLLVRKTPKYDRVKDTRLMGHAYIKEKLLDSW